MLMVEAQLSVLEELPMHWEMFVVVVHDTVDPQVVPGTAVGDVCRMQVAAIIEHVMHHIVHDISNIIGTHVVTEHPNLVLQVLNLS